jgi:hypothetical protein
MNTTTTAEIIMHTPGFFHQFPKLQPNDKLQEGLRAVQDRAAAEKGVTWRNRLLLFSGEAMVNIGKRLKRMSGICSPGQTANGIKGSAA